MFCIIINLMYLQMTIDVRDQGLPTPKIAQPNPAYVTVNVIRNLKSPLFFGSPYKANLRQDTQVPSYVLTVNATDSDQQVCFLFLQYQ